MAAALAVLIAIAGGGYWIFRDYDARRAEEVRRAIDVEHQSAEAQRKVNEEQIAAEARQREAKLEAEAQEAKMALQKANEERLAAEARQRQAKLEAEAQAAKMAQQKAEAEKIRRDQELKRAAAQRSAVESSAQDRKAGAAQSNETMLASAPEVQRTGKPPDVEKAAKDPRALDRFDGTYEGRMCSERLVDRQGKRCWPVTIKIERGRLLATWISKAVGKPGYAKGTISPDGSVSISLEGWLPDGRPIEGSMTGRWKENTIDASGAWKSGTGVTGNWKRAL